MPIIGVTVVVARPETEDAAVVVAMEGVVLEAAYDSGATHAAEMCSGHCANVRTAHTCCVSTAKPSASAPARLGTGCQHATRQRSTEQNDRHSFQHRIPPSLLG
jgi:hypothetical protein